MQSKTIANILLASACLFAVYGCGGGSADTEPAIQAPHTISTAGGKRHALTAIEATTSIPVFNSIVYDATKGADSKLASAGFSKLYVWPRKNCDKNFADPTCDEPTWKYQNSGPPPNDLNQQDKTDIKAVARGLCDSKYVATSGTTLLALDIEWPGENTIEYWTFAEGSPEYLRARQQFNNYIQFIKWMREGFNEVPSCAAKIKLGAYSTPATTNNICSPYGQLTQLTTAACNRHEAAASEMARALSSQVDYVSPVLYFDYSPVNPNLRDNQYRDQWRGKADYLIRLAKMYWNKPVIPFLGVRWFSTDQYKNLLLDADEFKLAAEYIKTKDIDGLILWDTDQFSEIKAGEASKPLEDYPWYVTMTSGWFQTNLQVAYDVSPSPIGTSNPVLIGNTWASTRITLTNPSASAAAVGLSIVLPQGWEVSNSNCATTIARLGNCNFQVIFRPTQEKDYSGQLRILLNNGTPSVISLIGTGKTTPLATLSLTYGGVLNPTPVNWLDQTIGSTTGSGTFTLTNTSATAANNVLVTPPANWRLDPNFTNTCTAGMTLASNASCTFRVQFLPQQAISYSGQLGLSFSNGTAPAITFIGKGVNAPSIGSGTGLSSSTVALGASSTFNWSTNNATSASISCSGAGINAISSTLSGSLSLVGTSVGQATCSITAKNSAGTLVSGNYTLTITPPPAVLALGYAGLVNYPTINWLDQTIGSITSSGTFTLTNTGASAATNVVVTPPANWRFDPNFTNSCSAGMTLASNASCTFRVQFLPQQAINYSGQLGLSLSNGTAPAITFIGKGVNAPSIGSSTGLSSGTVVLGASSTFNWSTNNATSASISCSGAGINATSSTLSGSLTLVGTTPGQAICALTAKNSAGTSVSSSYTLTITTPPAVLALGYAGLVNYPTINWLDQKIGSTTSSGTFTLTNTGASAATNVVVTPPANWRFDPNFTNSCSAGMTLASNASCTFRVQFLPQQAINYSGQLGLSLSNGTAPAITFIGKGVP